MRFYFFTEMPYPFVDQREIDERLTMRVTLPNRFVDPKVMAGLYADYLEQHQVADELGLNVMLNEHHQTATCTNAAIGVSAGAVVQRTRRARVLLLGYPLPHRPNPVQVAEEIAMLDCMSGGRLDAGFVRGVGTEIHPANTNPMHNRDRFYESFELIKKIWASDAPFSWEGKYFHQRYVNPFPRPLQQPHPPVWTTGGSDPANVAWAARNGVTYATLLGGFKPSIRVYDAYRKACREEGLAEPSQSRFANLFLVYVGDSEADAERGGREMMWYLSDKVAPWFRAPPGWAPVAARKGVYKESAARNYRTMSYEELSEGGLVLAGTPDTVVDRLTRFFNDGGASNILMMMHAGPMPQDRVLASMKRFSEEVMPRLAHLGADAEPAAPAPAPAAE